MNRIPTKQELEAVRNELKMHIEGVSRCTNILLSANADMAERFSVLIENVIGTSNVTFAPLTATGTGETPVLKVSTGETVKSVALTGMYMDSMGVYRKRSKTKIFEPIAIEFIKRLGRPASTSELYYEVRAKGVDVGGKNPASNLGAHLSHSKLLKKTADGWIISDQGKAQP